MAKAKPKPSRAQREEQDSWLPSLMDVLEVAVNWSSSEWSKDPSDLYTAVQARANVIPLTLGQFEADRKKWDATDIVEVTPHVPIFLPPLPFDTDYLPLLMLRWDFRNGGSGKRTIRLKLASLDAQSDNRLQIASVHMDAPNEAPWKYAHLQWTAKPTKEFRGIYHVPLTWMPQELPRLPLPAATPAELLVCCLVGLYGSSHELIGDAMRAVHELDTCEMMRRVLKVANQQAVA